MITLLASTVLYMTMVVAAYIAARGTVLLFEEIVNRPSRQRLDALLTWWGYPTGLATVIFLGLTIIQTPAGQGTLAVVLTAGLGVGAYHARHTLDRLMGNGDSVYDWSKDEVFSEAPTEATVITLPVHSRAS